jgi:4-diphosphocytidyl-2-C-methyl-D-erythritol kinase
VRSVTAFAPAKVNLALHVGPPRADGRHPIASLAAFADVGDRVTVYEGGSGLALSGPFAAALAGEGDNLMSRALALLTNRPVGAALEKNLPVASGIGGGSADAAAALRAARALFALPMDDAALEALSTPLGADVPVCVGCSPALMTGGGEIVSPVALAPLHGVLVNPGIALSTAAVYRRFDEIGVFGAAELASPPADLERYLLAARNDLEPAALALAPALGAVLARLRDDPLAWLARMSGSGATCFALTRTGAHADGLAVALKAERPAWWVAAVRLGAVDATPAQG